MRSTGPNPGSDYPTEVVERFSKKRTMATGYVSIVVGIAVCAIGYFTKELKLPEPHDNPA